MTLSESLEHYGVLGMKWGIRRYQPYPKGQHGTFLGLDRDKDIRITKGSEALRVQSKETLDPNAKATYIAFKNTDHIEYIDLSLHTPDAIAADCTFGKDGETGWPYSVKIVLDKDLIAPSYDTTMKTFVEVMSKTLEKVPVTEEILSTMNKPTRDLINTYKNIKSNETRDWAYLHFARNMMWDTKIRQIFFDALEKKGYNAIIDDHDQMLGVEGKRTDSPIIVFDKSALKTVGAKKVTREDKYEFEGRWTQTDRLKKNPNDEVAKAYLATNPWVKEWDDWMNTSYKAENIKKSQIKHAEAIFSMNLEHYIALGAEFIDMDNSLEHYGVKGMKWGRNTARSKTPTTSRTNISTVATGGGLNDIKNTLNNIGAKVNRDIFDKQLAAMDKHRRVRAEQLCASIVAKNKNTPISTIKNAFKSAGKWISDKISSLTKKSQPRLKQKLSPKFEESLKSADKFVTRLFRAKNNRNARSEGLTDNIRRKT